MSEEIQKTARKMSLLGRRKVFNSMLKRAIRRKGISVTMLAEAIDAEPGTVQHWVYGIHLPPAKYGGPLSDALDNGALETWLDSIYTYECVVCKSVFRVEGFTGPRKYCGDDCRRAAAKLGKPIRGTRITRELDVINLYKRSVAAFCHACANDPVCPNSGCELRAVSPLRTQEEIDATRPERRSVKWTEERKQRVSSLMKQHWADPKTSEKHVTAIRSGVAALNPAVSVHRSNKAKANWDRLPADEKERRIKVSTEALRKARKKL